MVNTTEKFCKHCGSPIRIDAKFCIKCGGALSQPSEVDKPSSLLDSIATGIIDTIDKRREAQKKAEQERIRTEYERIHVRTFNSSHEYDTWLRHFGTQIEIIDTAASKRHGLIYDGIRHKTKYTVTYKLKNPTPAQSTQSTVPTPPQ